ncbi:MAG: PAS domain S-box protein, partial [Thermoplasmatota archaeon]
LFPGFEKTPFYKTFKKVLKSKKPDHVVNRFVFPDGNVGYYDVSITPIKEGILCISRDISELKQAEEKLSESEKKYRNYLESAPDGVFVCDNDGTYLEVNEAAARITGYSKDELSTRSIRDMIPDDSAKESYDHFNRLKKVGKSDGTLKFKRKDGSIGYWNVSAVSLTENTYMGFVKDVTDQIKTQKVLRESEEKYRGVVDNIGIGVSLISKDMEIMFLNNKMQTWYPDISSDEKPICYKVYNNPPQDGPCSYCPTILTLKDGKIHESITQTLTPHGIINYRIVSSPIFKEDATVDMAIEIVEDITIMKQAEEKLIQMNKELDEKVKERTQTIEKILKQKDEFVNQLGHDLKNPLGPLLNLIPILEKRETNVEQKEMLNVMNRNVAFMKNLITKTIQLAQLNSPNVKFTIEKLNLTDILDDILSNNKMLCEKSHIQLVNNITKEIFVQGDTTHLQEVFNNLISNAVKYTKGSGTIIIDSKRSRNDDIIISIKDTGIGLTPNQTQKVFDEFYKVNHENHDFESSGLGMTITKRIIERHGGKIWVESAGIGKGCTFYFSLPLSTESDKNVTSLLTEIQTR